MPAAMRRGIGEEIRIVPDVLLAAQLARPDPVQPERALLATVLLDGIECFLQHHGATYGPRSRLFEEAEQWIFGKHDGSPLSFQDVCEFLSIDPAGVRTELRRRYADLPRRGLPFVRVD